MSRVDINNLQDIPNVGKATEKIFNTLGISNKETIKLKLKATGGMNFAIFFEIIPNKGIAKAKPNGTTIKSTGFTIFVLLFSSD